MRPRDAVGDYLTLVLRMDRLLPGTVDTYTGDAVTAAAIWRGPVPTPSELVRAAGGLADTLPVADLGPVRERFLRGQLRALEWTARRLAGQAVTYSDEVAMAYDTRPRRGVEDDYRQAHADLDVLLPGPGPLASRLAEHGRREAVPPDRLEVAVQALSEALRGATRALVPLPVDEWVRYRVVDDAPWSALHQYLGGSRSLVVVNAAARPRRTRLAQLVAHEAYPGHHTERCRKELGILAAGWDEHRVVVANSPQSLVVEGAAELGMQAVLGAGWGRVASEVLSGVGLGFDGELAERVDAATAVLARVRQDAALLLHGQRRPQDEVLGYLRRWALVDDARARQVLRFLRHPVWRSYTTTYVEGAALVRGWWERCPRPDRFLRLLDEPLTPATIRAEIGR